MPRLPAGEPTAHEDLSIPLFAPARGYKTHEQVADLCTDVLNLLREEHRWSRERIAEDMHARDGEGLVDVRYLTSAQNPDLREPMVEATRARLLAVYLRRSVTEVFKLARI